MWSVKLVQWLLRERRGWVNGKREVRLCFTSNPPSRTNMTYSGFRSDDAGTTHADVGHYFCSAEADAVYSCCWLSGYRWPLIIQSGLWRVPKFSRRCDGPFDRRGLHLTKDLVNTQNGWVEMSAVSRFKSRNLLLLWGYNLILADSWRDEPKTITTHNIFTVTKRKLADQRWPRCMDSASAHCGTLNGAVKLTWEAWPALRTNASANTRTETLCHSFLTLTEF